MEHCQRRHLQCIFQCRLYLDQNVVGKAREKIKVYLLSLRLLPDIYEIGCRILELHKAAAAAAVPGVPLSSHIYTGKMWTNLTYTN